MPTSVNETLNSPGRPLDASTRSFMESRFGQDFSGVRVHTDGTAAESARSVNALAYTVGRDIAFGSGRYAPHTGEGRHLIAHELAHTIQQKGSVQRSAGGMDTADAQSKYEREADAAADAVERGQPFNIQGDSAPQLARKDTAPDDPAAPPAPACPGPVKTVNVDFVSLAGSSGNPYGDLATANTIYSPCCVQFAAGVGVSAAPAQSNTWLGGDTTLNRGTSPSVVREEATVYDGATAAFGLSSRIRAFYVAAIDPPALATSRPPVWATGAAAPYVDMVIATNGAAPRSLAHEFGHLLLNATGAVHTTHPGGTANLMEPTATATGNNLDATQCATIYANA